MLSTLEQAMPWLRVPAAIYGANEQRLVAMADVSAAALSLLPLALLRMVAQMQTRANLQQAPGSFPIDPLGLLYCWTASVQAVLHETLASPRTREALDRSFAAPALRRDGGRG